MTRNDDKPPHVEAVRRRLEEAARGRPEPRFGKKRERKPRPSPATTLPGQRLFPFAEEEAS